MPRVLQFTRGSWRATIHGVTKSQTQLTTHVLCCVLAQLAQRVKHLPAKQETQVRFLGWEDPLEKKIATHSSTLAWKIPWTEKPGRPTVFWGVAKSRTSQLFCDFTFFLSSFLPSFLSFFLSNELF